MPPNKIFYNDIAVQAIKAPHEDALKDDLIKNWDVKSFTKKERWDKKLDRYDLNQYSDAYADDGKVSAIAENEIIDLSKHFIDGNLKWYVPEGEWTIVRYGYTSTGRRNNYASEGFKGGLCQVHCP